MARRFFRVIDAAGNGAGYFGADPLAAGNACNTINKAAGKTVAMIEEVAIVYPDAVANPAAAAAEVAPAAPAPTEPVFKF